MRTATPASSPAPTSCSTRSGSTRRCARPRSSSPAKVASMSRHSKARRPARSPSAAARPAWPATPSSVRPRSTTSTSACSHSTASSKRALRKNWRPPDARLHRLPRAAMPHAELNGFDIHYDVHGEGDPLLCVHGLGCDRRAWALQIEPFSKSYRTVFFDNRDVGQSSLAAHAYSTADMAQDVLALADHLELGTFHLLGISLGGMVSQQVALAAPERVRTLTLAVTHGGGQKAGRLRGHLLGSYPRHLPVADQVDNLL